MNEDLIKKGEIFESDDLDNEYRTRKKDLIYKSINISDDVPDGWKIGKEYKRKKRIYKEKDISIQLEDKVWRLFYEIGVKKIASRDFTIILKTRDGKEKTKQIDIVAIDEDIIFVIECKSQRKNSKRVLKQEIAEYSMNMNSIRTSIKKILEEDNLKFVFIFATENIIWDKNDRLDAEENNILVWDEYDILALFELAKIAGEGAKYQIYNRIFYGKKIKSFEIKVPALKGKMGGIPYYLFSLSPEHLLKISYVHHRSGKYSFLDLSNSYQRIIKKSRIEKIEQFIDNGGFFPGNIILNFNKSFTNEESLCSPKKLEGTTSDIKPVLLTMPPYYGCAWIIDGQHRLYGFADTEKKQSETIPVVAFTNMKEKLQSKVFVDINKNQKSIESDLLWDLYEDLYIEAEDDREKELYVISKIGKLLNSEAKSPFIGKITIPKEQTSGNISLTTICNSINQQKLISKSEGLLFSETYEDTIKYAFERISSFFDIIRNEMNQEWNMGDGHYVRTNSSIVVLMGILRDLLECNLAPKEINDISKFRSTSSNFLAPLLLHFIDADKNTIDAYRGAGGAGQKSRQIRAEFTEIIMNAGVGFRSTWREKYEEKTSKENTYLKKQKGLNYYLDEDESNNLEFKGSLQIDFKRYLLGDGNKINSKTVLEEGVLKTIVAFLNTKGGDVVIGILERNKFGENIEEIIEEKNLDFDIHNDKILVGIEIEYGKDDWDGYYQKLMSFIENNITKDVLDQELVAIEKIRESEKQYCLIKVSPSESKQYLNGKFYIRRGNKTEMLMGQEIDNYWNRKP